VQRERDFSFREAREESAEREKERVCERVRRGAKEEVQAGERECVRGVLPPVRERMPPRLFSSWQRKERLEV